MNIVMKISNNFVSAVEINQIVRLNHQCSCILVLFVLDSDSFYQLFHNIFTQIAILDIYILFMDSY